MNYYAQFLLIDTRKVYSGPFTCNKTGCCGFSFVCCVTLLARYFMRKKSKYEIQFVCSHA